jgi:transposase
MNIRKQAVEEYLTQGTGYRKLAAKYGVSKSTICKWLQIHQGIYNIPPTEKQQKYNLDFPAKSGTGLYKLHALK